jgi:TolB-like protein/Flp pilus assembly protein TadD
LAKPRPKQTGLFEELKRRKVLKAAAGYALVAWVTLQVAEVTFEPLGIPDWGLTVLIVLVIMGFPVVVVVSWFFDLTLKGFRKDARDAGEPVADEAAVARPSIAVLPFEDMSPGHDQAYLCDGIAEEILNRLSQIENLHVASRTSSFRFRGMPISARQIGRELNVAAVLEGSVRKAGDRLRITTQLINARDDFHLWSSSYDRDLAHIFEIETEIAAHVANALEVKLGTRGEEECCTTSNARAYEYFLKGQHYFRRWGTTNFAYAVKMFESAVATDPTYARAWAALADSHSMICMYWDVSEEHLEAADRASIRALELLPGLAESHVSRGLNHFVRRQSAAAIAEFETALRLDPNLFDAYYFYGRVRFQQGELEHAAELFEKAEQIDPDDFQAPILLRQIYHSQGRDEDALAAARRGIERAERRLELNPDDTRALNLGLGGLAALGEKDKVLQFAERSLAIDGENPDTLYNVACGYALIGKPERALDCLERASVRGMAIAEWAENDSDLESLHALPRFRGLIERLRAGEAGGED